MSDSQRRQYAAVLHAKQRELLDNLLKREGLNAEAEPDVFDEIQRAADRALVVDALDRNSELLREVRAALHRLGEGTYGQCLGCDEEINPKRLAAVPWAGFCLECQERVDRGEQEDLADDLLSAA